MYIRSCIIYQLYSLREVVPGDRDISQRFYHKYIPSDTNNFLLQHRISNFVHPKKIILNQDQKYEKKTRIKNTRNNSKPSTIIIKNPSRNVELYNKFYNVQFII